MIIGVLVGVSSIFLAVKHKDTEMRTAILQQTKTIDIALGWSTMYESVQSAEELIAHNAAKPKAENPPPALAKVAVDRARMAKICAVYADCKAIYLMRRNANNEIYFLIDSSPEKTDLFIEPGTVYYEAHKVLHKTFVTGNTVVDGPESDRWGVWMSAFVPHVMPDKSLVVLGMDVDGSDWDRNLWKAALNPLIATIAFLAMMLLYTLLWRSENKHIESLEKSQSQLVKMSNEDSLTGLPNRRLFDDRLEQMIAFSMRSKSKFAMLYLDLDKFKEVNDKLGHQTGDQLLCVVADRLKSVLRDEDTVARLAGDEFAMLLPRVERREDAEQVANKIMQSFAKPVTLHDQELHIAASIGIAFYSEQHSTAFKLLKAADEALYKAKEKGANRYYFADETRA